jgi:hypothetical protein
VSAIGPTAAGLEADGEALKLLVESVCTLVPTACP